MDARIEQVAAALRGARGVVVLTGAGISAESGLRTFRESMDGLWKDFDPMTLATPEAFAADPERVTRWYDWRRLGCLDAEPNPGHLALAAIERDTVARGGAFTLLTQNVDRLHQRAGSVHVVELHGSIVEWRCTRTGRMVTPEGGAFAEFPAKSPFDERGLMRPNVVWFGEALPEAALDAAERALETCDVFLTIGTSAVVHPAAGFIWEAKRRGAFVVEVNREETAASSIVDVSLRGRAGETLCGVVEEMNGSGAGPNLGRTKA